MEPGELAVELSYVAHQLVALSGLDINNHVIHKTVWEAFVNNRRPDRLPLHFKMINAEQEFPRAKPKRGSYDSYIPRGILKSNWMRKHLQEIPAVVVLFMDLDWDNPSWSEKKAECQSKVESLRHSLEGRNTRLAVVLIQNSAPLPPGEDMLAAERATELCQICDLSPKSLFVLPHTDHLFGYILRLEHAFHELAQVYYQTEIRRVKSKKELLSKATHQSLLVRCQFKLAMFNELRQDSHTALRHYKLAYQHLTEAQFPDTQWLEWKTVAGLLNYKICRLCFHHNTPLDSISHFRRHVDFFRRQVGVQPDPTVAQFEHHCWLSRQFGTFGELFEGAVQQGLAAVQIQHPGFYYQSAAQEAMARKAVIELVRNSLTRNTEEQEIDGTTKLEFYGQRVWRVGLAPGQLKADDAKEEAGIEWLKMTECHKDLSSPILQWLNAAMGQFRKYKCPRMRRFIMVQLAEEYLKLGQFAKALQLFTHCIWEYRQEKWFSIVGQLIFQALQCAYCLANVKEYVTLTLELLNPQMIEISLEERTRIQINLTKLLAGSLPDPEPALDEKTVNLACEIWTRDLNERCFFMVQMHQIYSCVQVKAWFSCNEIRADQEITLQVCLRLICPQPISFRKLTVGLNPNVYDHKLVIEDLESLNLMPNEPKSFSFKFVPRPDDVGNDIQVSFISLDVGHRQSAIYGTFHWEGAGSEVPYSVGPEFATSISSLSIFERNGVRNVIRVLPRKAVAKVTLEKKIALLLNEVYVIRFSIVNKENQTISAVRLMARCETTDSDENAAPTLLLRNDATQFADNMVLPLQNVIVDQQIDSSFVCCALECGTHQIDLDLSYQISTEVGEESIVCVCSCQETITIDATRPFDITSKLLSISGEPVESLVNEEKALVLAEIKSISGTNLILQNATWQIASHLEPVDNKLISTAPNAILKSEECYVFVLPIKPKTVQTQPVEIGQLLLVWKRHSDDDNSVAVQTRLALPAFPVNSVPLLVCARLPACGYVRRPTNVTYTFENMTDTVLELQLALDGAESFMFSGLKQVQIRLLPRSSRSLHYVLFPLVAGHVTLPRFRITSSSYSSEIFDKWSQRTVPTQLFVLPFGKLANEGPLICPETQKSVAEPV